MSETTPYQPLTMQQIGSNAKQLINSSPGYWKNWKNDLYREYTMQQATAEQQNAFNVAMWNAENEYNLPVNQMQRFQDAGLNPNLIYGQQNTSASAPNAASGVNFNVAGHRKNQLSKNQATVNQLMELAGLANTVANTMNNIETAKQNRLYTGQLTAKAAVDTARAQFAYDFIDGLTAQGKRLDNKLKLSSYVKSQAGLQFLIESIYGKNAGEALYGISEKYPSLDWLSSNGRPFSSDPEGRAVREVESNISSRLAAAFNAFASGSLHTYQRDVMGPEQLRALMALTDLREKEGTIKSVTADAIQGFRSGDPFDAIGNTLLLFLLGEVQ